MRDATTERESVTNLLAVLFLAAVVALAWFVGPELRNGWQESASARARMGDQP